MILGLLPGCGYTGSYTSSTPCSLFCSGLTQLVFFLLRLLFQQCRMLCHVWFCFFSPSLFVESFAGHFDNTIVPYRQPLKLHFENKMVPCQLPLRLTLRNVPVRLPRITCLFSDFSQREYHYSTKTNVFSVYGHTYVSKLTYTCVLQSSPTSVGLTQARPNY